MDLRIGDRVEPYICRLLYPLQILPNILQQLRDRHVFVFRQKVLELFASLCKLTERAFEIMGLYMVERCGYLDKPLDKNPVYIPVFMPQVFKYFVSFEKPLTVEFFQPTVKSLIHHTVIIANRAYKFKAKSLPNWRISASLYRCFDLFSRYR